MLNFLKRYWFVFLFSFLFLIPKSYCFMPNSVSSYHNYIGGSWSNAYTDGDMVNFGAGVFNNKFLLGRNDGSNSSCSNEINYYGNAKSSCFDTGLIAKEENFQDISKIPHGLMQYGSTNGVIDYPTVDYRLFLKFMSNNLQNNEDIIVIHSFAFYNSFNTNKVDYSHYINKNKLRFDLSDDAQNTNNVIVTENSFSFNVYDYSISFADGICLNTDGTCNESQLVYNITYVTVETSFKWSSNYSNKVFSRLINVDLGNTIYSDLGVNSNVLGEVFVPRLYRVTDYNQSNVFYSIDYFTDYTQLMYLKFPSDLNYSRIYFNSCMLTDFSYTYYSPDLSNFNGIFFKGDWSNLDLSLDFDKSLPYKVEYDSILGTPSYYVEFDRTKGMDFVFLYTENTLAGTNQEQWYKEITPQPTSTSSSDSSSLGFFGKVLNWFTNGWNWVKENVIGIGSSNLTKTDSSNNSVSVSKSIARSCTISFDSRVSIQPVVVNYTCFEGEDCEFLDFTLVNDSGDDVYSNRKVDLTSQVTSPSSYINYFVPSLNVYSNIFTSIFTSDGSDSDNLFIYFITLFLFIVLIIAISRRFKI